jgi:hypothetical protein
MAEPYLLINSEFEVVTLLPTKQREHFRTGWFSYNWVYLFFKDSELLGDFWGRGLF